MKDDAEKRAFELFMCNSFNAAGAAIQTMTMALEGLRGDGEGDVREALDDAIFALNRICRDCWAETVSSECEDAMKRSCPACCVRYGDACSSCSFDVRDAQDADAADAAYENERLG